MSFLKKTDDLRLRQEQKIQNKIFTSIYQNKSIIFSAGAGAGKTYALVESLKHILKYYGDTLQRHNQKIICITYTNVATNEIKERLGHSDLVKISTIHERLWDIIKGYKKELLLIHKDKLTKAAALLKEKLDNDTSCQVYQNLEEGLKNSFKKYIIESKDNYYKNRDKSADGIRVAFDNDLRIYPNILRNIGNFKIIADTILKIEKCENCLTKIESKDNDYKIVKYESKYNRDILHKMLISHDTLLEYSLKIISQYNLLKQIIIDSYPYILIDEYQDTDETVIKIMQEISLYSKKIEHNLFIGYFGDTAQNIYNNGIGNKITEIHPNLKRINKVFNRRSCGEVIDVITKIRNDNIKQKSIYEDCKGGSVKFYVSNSDNKNEVVNKFIQKHQQQWEINKENKLHCLLLTNKLVAEMSGFSKIYESFAGTEFYEKNYDRINTELLSNDLAKLGDVQNTFYKILKLNVLLENPKTPLINLFDDKELFNELSFKELQDLIHQLKAINGITLNEYIKAIFIAYESEEISCYYKQAINRLINLENYSYQSFFNYVLNKLFRNSDDASNVENIKKINQLLDIDIEQYKLWYYFIINKHDSDIVYHTYHGTKGDEFANVVIIMENDFGRQGRNKFSSFFKNLAKENSMDEDARLEFENTKNLLYVSCSRAIKNLSVLYLDDTSSFSDGIKSIFSETRLWPFYMAHNG